MSWQERNFGRWSLESNSSLQQPQWESKFRIDSSTLADSKMFILNKSKNAFTRLKIKSKWLSEFLTGKETIVCYSEYMLQRCTRAVKFKFSSWLILWTKKGQYDQQMPTYRRCGIRTSDGEDILLFIPCTRHNRCPELDNEDMLTVCNKTCETRLVMRFPLRCDTKYNLWFIFHFLNNDMMYKISS